MTNEFTNKLTNFLVNSSTAYLETVTKIYTNGAELMWELSKSTYKDFSPTSKK